MLPPPSKVHLDLDPDSQYTHSALVGAMWGGMDGM
jgi:hypothetical protein